MGPGVGIVRSEHLTACLAPDAEAINKQLPYRTIPLTQGYVAVVDAEDYETISCYNWCAIVTKSGPYAGRQGLVNGKLTTVYMHQQIAKPANGYEVDHADHDGLNNRRGNLRVCTRAQHVANRRAGRNNTSGYKGVSWIKQERKWRATIGCSGKDITLGRFSNPVAAAHAYDAAALHLFGSFAHLNFDFKEGKGQSEMCAGKAHKIEYPKNPGGGLGNDGPSPTTEAKMSYLSDRLILKWLNSEESQTTDAEQLTELAKAIAQALSGREIGRREL